MADITASTTNSGTCKGEYGECQYRQILDSALLPLVVTSLESQNILYLNQAAAKFFGLERDKAIGMNVLDFWTIPDLRKEFTNQVRTYGQVEDFEARITTAGNQHRFITISGNAIEFDGQPAISAVFKDITEQHIADKALKKSEENYHKLYNLMRLMADTVPDLIWAKDANNRYLFANKALCETLLICDYEGEAIGNTDLYFTERERKRGHDHTFGQICANTDELVKETKKPGRFREDGMVRGKYLLFDVHKAPMFDHNGQIIGTVGTAREITEEIKKQEAQRATEARYKLLAQNIRDVIWTMDQDFKFTYVSPSIEELTGYTPEEFSRLKSQDVISPSSLHTYIKYKKYYSKRSFNSSEVSLPLCWEMEIKHKNGSTLWAEIVTSELRDEKSRFLGVVGVNRDITTRVESQKELTKAKEEAQAANKAKSEFLANMSHEIRTPMNGILGMLQLLQSSSMNPTQQEYVNTALQSGSSLLTLITDILDFSKIEAGKMILTPVEFNLWEVLQTLTYSFQNQINESEIELILELSDKVPIWVRMDKSRLQQILFNLLGNAVKFTDHGKIHLKVDGMHLNNNRVRLSFTLEDTGLGIAESQQDKLFEPFVQADGSFQRKYKGTGLGLSIVRKLINLMEGTISLTSFEGKGTTVKFDIITHAATAKQQNSIAKDKKHLPQIPAAITEGNILVVEDEQINAMVIQAMLKNLGHKSTHANNGSMAVELLKKESFDCILMDIQMPEMDGLETAKAIRSIKSDKENSVPIIAVTAHAMKGDRENFLSAGMDEYLTKPVDAKTLEETLQRILASKYGTANRRLRPTTK